MSSKTFLDVLQVALASFFGFGVILYVVVAVGHAEAALINVGDHVLGVVGVLR